jgi:hypothetical protein
MKKLIISAIVLLAMVSFTAQAQSRTTLKGPAAKNYKPWEDTEKSSVRAVSYANKEDKKGPAAKNQKVWEKQSTNNEVMIVGIAPKNKLMGPAAKNRKIWEENENNDVQVARKAKEQSEISN